MSTQPLALRLAEYLESDEGLTNSCNDAAAELRRLHEENAKLRQALKQAQQVAYVLPEFWEQLERVNCATAYRLPGEGRQPLYTASPPRQPLTNETLQDLWHKTWPDPGTFVRVSAEDLRKFANNIKQKQ